MTRMRQLLSVMLVAITMIITASFAPAHTCVQEQGMQAAEFIEEDQAVELTFHKIVDGKEGPALDLTDPNLKFLTGDVVRVEYKAPFDSFVYIVNATTSGRTELQFPRRSEQNVKIPANQTKGFSFRLTNRSGIAGPVKEDLVFVISPVQVNSPTLNELLANYAQLDQLNKEIQQKGRATPEQNQQVKQLESATKLKDAPAEFLVEAQEKISKKVEGNKVVKTAKVIGRIACTIASSWLGGLFKTACSGGIFGAAEFEEDDGNVIHGSPETKTEKLFIRLSFQHEGK